MANSWAGRPIGHLADAGYRAKGGPYSAQSPETLMLTDAIGVKAQRPTLQKLWYGETPEALHLLKSVKACNPTALYALRPYLIKHLVSIIDSGRRKDAGKPMAPGGWRRRRTSRLASARRTRA